MEKQRDGAVGVTQWTMTQACVYLSSPIDHHLKQEERGRETRVQFNTSAHEGDGTAQRQLDASGECKAGLSCPAWGLMYSLLTACGNIKAPVVRC